MTFILPSFGASAISAVPGGGGGGGSFSNTYSLDFDGTDDYVSTELSVAGQSELTVSSWVKLDNSSATRGIVTQYVGGGNRAFRLALFPTISSIQGFWFEVYGSGSYAGYKYASQGAIPTGSWLHVAGVFSQSSCVVYVNGVASTTTGGLHFAGTGNIASCTDNIDIGRQANGDYMDGKIDEVGIWTSALSASDITAIYNSGSGPTDISTIGNSGSGPSAWYRMGDTGSDYGTTTITNAANAGTNDATIENQTGGTNTSGAAFSTDVPVASTFTNTYSLDFDGTDDYVDTNSTFQSTYQSSHTISFWFKLDTTSGLQGLFGAWSGPTSQNAIYFDGSANITSRYRVASSPKSTLSASFTPDTNWHHYAVTLEQSGSNLIAKAYLDGVYKSTTTTAIDMSGFSQSLNSLIGLRGGKAEHINGKMDEVAIIGSALSDGGVSTGQTASGDIATLYNNGVPGDITTLNPVGWWRMGDTGSDYGTATITNAATESNSGGSSINGTIVNGSSGNTSPTYSTDVPS